MHVVDGIRSHLNGVLHWYWPQNMVTCSNRSEQSLQFVVIKNQINMKWFVSFALVWKKLLNFFGVEWFFAALVPFFLIENVSSRHRRIINILIYGNRDILSTRMFFFLRFFLWRIELFLCGKMCYLLHELSAKDENRVHDEVVTFTNQ